MSSRSSVYKSYKRAVPDIFAALTGPSVDDAGLQSIKCLHRLRSAIDLRKLFTEQYVEPELRDRNHEIVIDHLTEKANSMEASISDFYKHNKDQLQQNAEVAINRQHMEKSHPRVYRRQQPEPPSTHIQTQSTEYPITSPSPALQSTDTLTVQQKRHQEHMLMGIYKFVAQMEFALYFTEKLKETKYYREISKLVKNDKELFFVALIMHIYLKSVVTAPKNTHADIFLHHIDHSNKALRECFSDEIRCIIKEFRRFKRVAKSGWVATCERDRILHLVYETALYISSQLVEQMLCLSNDLVANDSLFHCFMSYLISSQVDACKEGRISRDELESFIDGLSSI